MMAGDRRAESQMEVEAGEMVTDGSDFEMPELSVEMPELSSDGRMFEVRSGGDECPRLGSNGRKALEDSACSKETPGAFNGGLAGDAKGKTPPDVLLAAEAAMPVNGNGNGAASRSNEEQDESEEDVNVDAMVEPDSDLHVESDDSSDASSDEEEDVNAADTQKHHIEGAEELNKMVKRAKEVDSDEEDGATEPPRTQNEDLPPVPGIEAILAPNQVPQEVGFVSSIMDKQVIVQAVDHEMVLNEGSILWLTQHRKPLGIVDEVFGPVKKPYYLIRYNKAADVPDVASQGVTVGFVQEFANFVLNDSELWKKGYDASGQHDEEVSDEEEFSDDEKEEEAKRLGKQGGHKQGLLQVGVGGDGGRGGGRGAGVGGGGGGRHKAGGRNGRGRGGGRGRFSKSDSANMLEVDEATKAQAAGRGHQRSNSLGSPVFSRDKGLGEHRRQNSFSGQFHPSLDRQNSWNRSSRSDVNYPQVPDLRSPMVNYNERQYQSPHHDFVSGIRPIQQHLSPQRSPGPPHWGPSSGPPHGEVHQVQPPPYLGPNVRWSHQATGPDSGLHLPLVRGDYQHPEGMYQQARVNLVPMASYPLPQPMSMYPPSPQPAVGTGVFIPPAQYVRNSQGGNQMQMQQTQQGQGQQTKQQSQKQGQQLQQSQGLGMQMQGSVYPGLDGRGPVGGQWPANCPSIVTGIPCYSNPPQPIFLQPGHIRPGMIAPGPNSNVYWTNNPGR